MIPMHPMVRKTLIKCDVDLRRGGLVRITERELAHVGRDGYDGSSE